MRGAGEVLTSAEPSHIVEVQFNITLDVNVFFGPDVCANTLIPLLDEEKKNIYIYISSEHYI